MNKILINATVLKQMLEAQPEVEIELVKNATAQIAEVLKRKVNENKSAIFDNAVTEINSRLNYKYHLPDQVLKVIRSAVEDEIKKFNENQASKMAKEAFEKAIVSYEKKLETRIDAMITTSIEKKVNAVFAAAAKLR
jgi:adenosine deaminase